MPGKWRLLYVRHAGQVAAFICTSCRASAGEGRYRYNRHAGQVPAKAGIDPVPKTGPDANPAGAGC